MHRNRFVSGFTLIELLVVMAIVALLISLLLPSLSRSVETSRRATCMSNLRQMSICASIYSNDFSGALPYQANIWVFNPAVMDYAVWRDWNSGSYIPNGWGAFVYSGYVPLTLLSCPSNTEKWQNIWSTASYWNARTGIANAQQFFPNKTNPALIVDYGYRFNNSAQVNTLGSQFVKNTANPAVMGVRAYEAPIFNGCALFHEAWGGQMSFDGLNTIFSTWGHFDGGTVACFDGSAKFVANVILTPTNTYPYRGQNWPGTYYQLDYGSTTGGNGLDLWVKQGHP